MQLDNKNKEFMEDTGWEVNNNNTIDNFIVNGFSQCKKMIIKNKQDNAGLDEVVDNVAVKHKDNTLLDSAGMLLSKSSGRESRPLGGQPDACEAQDTHHLARLLGKENNNVKP